LPARAGTFYSLELLKKKDLERPPMGEKTFYILTILSQTRNKKLIRGNFLQDTCNQGKRTFEPTSCKTLLNSPKKGFKEKPRTSERGEPVDRGGTRKKYLIKSPFGGTLLSSKIFR